MCTLIIFTSTIHSRNVVSLRLECKIVPKFNLATFTQKKFQIMRNKGVKNIPHPIETQYK